MIILENELVRLRAVEDTDIDLIFQWENDPEVWLVSNTITPFSRYVIKRYIETAHHDIFQAKQLRLMIETNNIPGETVTIGTIDLFDFDPLNMRAGVGILIGNNLFRKQGYAKAALNILIRYSFEKLFLHQLYCNIAKDNEASIKLFTTLGFQIIGEKKDWIFTGKSFINEYMLQLVKGQ